MISRFFQWVVLDFADYRDWGGERYARFGVVTKNGTSWDEVLPNERLNLDAFVLVVLLEVDRALDTTGFDVKLILGPKPSRGFPVWCHYGGNFPVSEVAEKWSRYELLSPDVKDALVARMPGPELFPMPFGSDERRSWYPHWERIHETIASGRATERWDHVMRDLNTAWELATSTVRTADRMHVVSRWLAVQNSIIRLLSIPSGDDVDVEAASLLREWGELGLSQLGQAAESAATPAGGSEFEQQLRKWFSLARDSTNDLEASQDVEERRTEVSTLRERLREFKRLFDQELGSVPRLFEARRK